MKLEPGTSYSCPVCCNEYSTDDNPELCLNIANHRDRLLAENKILRLALARFARAEIRLGAVMTTISPHDVRRARKLLKK